MGIQRRRNQRISLQFGLGMSVGIGLGLGLALPHFGTDSHIAQAAHPNSPTIAAQNPAHLMAKKPAKTEKREKPKPIKATAHPFGKWCLGYRGLDDDLRFTMDALAKVAGTRDCDRLVTNLSHAKQLDLSGTGITDLAPLADLRQLKTLVLSRNYVRDLTPLMRLNQLESLVIRGSRVGDLTPLANLTALRSIVIEDSKISDLSPLRGLRQLGTVSIAGNWEIQDLSPLAVLNELTHLNISRTRVSDLSPLVGLQFLNELRADESMVSTVRPILGLMGLEVLTVNRSQIDAANAKDLGTFVNLKRLEILGIPLKQSPCPLKMRSGSVCLFHQG